MSFRPARLIAVTSSIVVVGIGLPGPAQAVDPGTGPDYEVPFLCAQKWTGTTRRGHSPGYNSIDWNRPNDLGQPILASAPGVVTKVVPNGTVSYGRYAIVDHGRGNTSLYAHMKQTWMVPGMRVDQGQPVGLLGSTGNSSGPHLHFEERVNGRVSAPYFHRKKFTFNTTIASQNCPDTPITGDWNADGKTDVGTVRRTSSGATIQRREENRTTRFSFGTAWDRYFTGDWDGNGKTDIGLRAPGSTNALIRYSGGATTRYRLGNGASATLSGDWNGDRKDEIGIWDPGKARFTLRQSTGALTNLNWGYAGDLPVTGDWDGDAKSDVGIWRPSNKTFYLRTVKNGRMVKSTVVLGTATDQPVSGDWNGDKIDDVGVWSPTRGTFTQRWVPKGSTRASTRTITLGTKRG